MDILIYISQYNDGIPEGTRFRDAFEIFQGDT